MTITYNGWELKIDANGLQENISSTVAEWDGWGSNGYVRRQMPYGTFLNWTLTGMEATSVVWANSVIGSLRAQMGSLLSGSLVFNEGDLYSGTYTSYVRNVSWWVEGRNRMYSVDFQQDQT